MMHLDHRVGSLEKGKDADFVVLSGPPFSVYTQVLETYIDGKKVFDRPTKRDWAYQAGGFALPTRGELPAPSRAGRRPPAKAPAAAEADRRRPQAGAKRLVVLAGRVHTVAGDADRRTASSSSRTARSPRSAARRGDDAGRTRRC